MRGQGIDALRAALSEILAAAPPPRDAGKPRLPIDRVFTLRGVGTVVTGTLTGGTLPRGAAVIVQPSGRAGHVRSVQSHGREQDAAACGTRAAFNVPEFSATGDDAVARGEVLTLPGLGAASAVLDVLLTRFDRAPAGTHAAAPLRDGTHVRVHHGQRPLSRAAAAARRPRAGAGRERCRAVALRSTVVRLRGRPARVA